MKKIVLIFLSIAAARVILRFVLGLFLRGNFSLEDILRTLMLDGFGQ